MVSRLLPIHILMGSRWVSLIIVMSGVALVGFSGSLIKDTIKESGISSLVRLVRADLPPSEPIEEPEVTKVLVGEFFSPAWAKVNVLSISFISVRCILYTVRSNLVSIFARHVSVSSPGDTTTNADHSTATQFVVEG